MIASHLNLLTQAVCDAAARLRLRSVFSASQPPGYIPKTMCTILFSKSHQSVFDRRT